MPEADRPLRVFLCHSSNDKPVVRDLYRRLDAEGWMDVWLDEVKLYPGQDWNFEIEKAVEEVDVILVCLTKNSVNKEGYVQRELRIVLDLADYKPEGTLFVIPVRLEECDPPRRLRSWQYADYFPKENRDAAYQRLLVSLRMRAKRLGISTVNPAEEKARHDAEEFARRQAEELKRRQAEDDARRKKEALDRKAAQDRARSESEERASKQKVEERLTEVKAEPRIETARPQNNSQEGTAVGGRIKEWVRQYNLRPYGIGLSILLVAALGIFGVNSMIQNSNANQTATPTFTQSLPTLTVTSVSPTRTLSVPTNTPTVALTPVPTLGIGSAMISPKDGMTLLYVPAGEFTMGSDSGSDDEKPVHKVDLNAFWIDQTEVTNKMYSMCVAAGVCKEPNNKGSYIRTSYYGNIEFENYPVIYVDWNMAKAYCEWADRRLPTEAEWEKAARGTDGRTYPWGNEPPNKDLLNYNSNVGDTTEVGKYPDGKSIYGAFDMAGNVWEWVNDWYSETYYQNSPSSNPLGPDSGQYRVLRGGAWYLSDNLVRSAYRVGGDPSGTNHDFGFRCSRSP